MKRRTFGTMVLLAAAGIALAACSRDPVPPSINEIFKSNSSFSTLAAALEAADQGSGLEGKGPLTVFAPRNSAFDALPAGRLDELLLPENRALLTSILRAHVVNGTYTAADLVNKTTELTSLDGTTFIVDGFDGVNIGTINVVQPDVVARNGVIHVIDGILLP